MIQTRSLAKTLETINDSLFFGNEIDASQIPETVEWICKRQSKSGKNAGMFVPTVFDYTEGIRLFTGEKLNTRLAARNILSQEASRALILLNVASDETQAVLDLANQQMLQSCYAADFCARGECKHSFVGFMRYLAASGLEDYEDRLQKHVEVLKQRRNGKGRWEGFPFYYTLLALSEISSPSALEELEYALPAIARSLKRTSKTDRISKRRFKVLHTALAKIEGSLEQHIK